MTSWAGLQKPAGGARKCHTTSAGRTTKSRRAIRCAAQKRLSIELAAQGLQKKQPAPAGKVVDAEKSVVMEEKLPLVSTGSEGRAVARKEVS